MFQSRFFWKLYSGFATLALVTSAVIGGLVHYQLRTTLMLSSENNLRKDLNFFSEIARDYFETPSDSLLAKITSLGDRWQQRITLISPDGNVIADSGEDPDSMDNHLSRPEIQTAMRSEFGVARRFSKSVNHLSLYVAHTIRDGQEPLGIVRLSIPLRQEEDQLAGMGRIVFIGALVGVCVSLLLGAIVTQRVVTPINQIREVAEAMRMGNYQKRVTKIPADEIGLLGDTFNRLGSELTHKITTLSHEEAQLRAILSNMVEGVIAIGIEDVILFCNRAALRLLGETETLAGKKLWQFTQYREIHALFEKVKSTQSPHQTELKLELEKGQVVVKLFGSYFTGTNSEGVILVLQDISDLRRLERIRRDFVANVSHELKTPLTAIRGYVETLLDGALDDKTHNRRFVEKIDRHVVQLTLLVRDLLKLGELESDDLKLVEERVDLNGVVSEVYHRYDLERSDSPLKCTLTVAPSNPIILGNREAIVQVVDNLLSNAIKYTPEGGEVHLKIFAEGDRGGFLVSDTGIGIPQKEIPRIFERFYRVDKARSREMGGTGLGLSIVKHLVNNMHGKIDVQSTLQEGSQFTVVFPKAT